ncbi:FimV/HubP family polar landmark protein, partial [Vibrio tubiashii]
MRRLLQRLLLPLAMVAVTQTTIVNAESIRLKGPNGEIQSSPQFSEPLARDARTAEPSRFYGPTTEQETLWSIASQLRPSNAVTVQQTLYAIFQLNPQAFENQNIHELIPQSTIRIPSLSQVRSVSTQEAVNVMAAHQARLGKAPSVATPQPQAPAVNIVPVQQPDDMAKPMEKVVDNAQEKMVDKNSDLKGIADAEKQKQVKSLENQLETSETELMALEEKNHKLRLMLADVQSEVDVLKDELGNEDRIRTEVEKLLEAERMRLAEEQKMAPSAMDQLFSNTWLVAALAIIPGLLIGLIIMMLLGRRSKEEPQAAPTEQQPQPVAPVVPETLNEDIDDDLLLDDDLFGESDKEEELFGDDSIDPDADSDEVDVFADLDDGDLDFNLEGEDSDDPFAGIGDDGDLDESLADVDVDMSSNGISVNGDDKALGLEEMERALDEVVIEDSDDEGFDLSDDGEFSQDELDSLLAEDGESEELGTDELDQSLLDDLFNEAQDDSSDDLDFDSLLDEGEDSFDLSDDSTEPSLASDSEIDDIFAQMEAQADLETLEANALDETALLDEVVDEEGVEVSADSTELLDELLEESAAPQESSDEVDAFDELISVDEPAEESTDLLDEFIAESEGADEFDLDSELDELIGDDTPAQEIDLADSTDLLADVVGSDPQADSSEDLGDDATDLFEELLEIDQQEELPEPASQPELEADSTDVPSIEEEAPTTDNKDFASEDFIDDLLSVAPEGDPLLDELDLDDVPAADVTDDLALDTEIDQAQLAEPEPEPEPE